MLAASRSGGRDDNTHSLPRCDGSNTLKAYDYMVAANELIQRQLPDKGIGAPIDRHPTQHLGSRVPSRVSHLQVVPLIQPVSIRA